MRVMPRPVGRPAGLLLLATLLVTGGTAGAQSPPTTAPATKPATAAARAGGLSPTGSPGATAGTPVSLPPSAFPRPARAVATIVAPRWTNEDDRDDAREAERVMALVGVRAGMRVADIGAGDGYYVARLSPRVGATGLVYGEDIIPQYLELLKERVQRERLANVRVVYGKPHDAQLPPGGVDAALMIHMYHEIEQPFALLWHLIPSMAPGGRLAVLDLDRPTWGHGTPPALLRCELGALGFREVKWEWLAEGEYVAVFEAPTVEQRPSPEALRARLSRSPCLP
jgi:SAM-dependent methyltransferase